MPQYFCIFFDPKIVICKLLGLDLGDVWESKHKISAISDGEMALFATKKSALPLKKVAKIAPKLTLEGLKYPPEMPDEHKKCSTI